MISVAYDGHHGSLQLVCSEHGVFYRRFLEGENEEVKMNFIVVQIQIQLHMQDWHVNSHICARCGDEVPCDRATR